jgi:GNAT superfamily N-acetyltransferase
VGQFRVAAFRWGLFWATAMLEMVGGTAWTDARAQALAVLRPPGAPRPRMMTAMLGVALVVAAGLLLVWAMAPPLAWALGAATLLAVLGPPRFLRLRGLPCSHQLYKLRPKGSYCLQGLVRDPAARGAGARLVEALCAQADVKGWVLSLEAGDEWLRGYYAGLGFVPSGPPVTFPWGQVRTSMHRVPMVDGAVAAV